MKTKDNYPEESLHNNENGEQFPSSALAIRYIAYPKAMKSLKTRYNATPEELAAWVWLGRKDGGLNAYLNANELDPPPRFYFSPGGSDDFNYLSPLMGCWFIEKDIANFDPVERFITGKSLIERWSQYAEVQPEPFIRAKIGESRLSDIHPICGGTQGTSPDDASFPPLSAGLFSQTEIELIEEEDFSIHKPVNMSDGTRPKGHLNHDPQMQLRANEIAAELKKENKRKITRELVAKPLAKELNMDKVTVLRRIRKQW